jgi:transcriptional regulator with XRE-family HTH domain
MLRGNRLKELRVTRGITQDDLGKVLGVTKASICCYEKGTRTPTIENLLDLVDYFGVSSDYLLGTDKIVFTKKDKPKTYLMTDEEVRLIEYLRKSINYETLIKDPLILISKLNN